MLSVPRDQQSASRLLLRVAHADSTAFPTTGCEKSGARRDYDEWQKLRGKTTKAKWELAATIFEDSLRYQADSEAKAALVAEVNRLPDVQAAKRWEASMEVDAADILLVTVFGIGETKSSKSQWLKAIRKGRNFASDRDSFCSLAQATGDGKAWSSSCSMRRRPPIIWLSRSSEEL